MGLFGDILGFAGGLIGSNKQADTQEDINRDQLASSKEYAQNSIQWRVEDAKKAGIHPLAAMGLPLASAPTLSVGNTDYASTYSDMGQSLGRAADAVMTRDERAATAAMDALKLERASLENDLLRSQITSVQRSMQPAMPSNSDMPLLVGQGNGYPTGGLLPPPEGYVNESPLSRVHSAPGRPAQEVGAVPDVGFARTATGYAPVPSQDVKNRIEDMVIPEILWADRNLLRPNLGQAERPSDSLLPSKYHTWIWNKWKQEWQPKLIRDIW